MPKFDIMSALVYVIVLLVILIILVFGVAHLKNSMMNKATEESLYEKPTWEEPAD